MPKDAVAAESLQSRLDAGERFDQSQLLNLLHTLAKRLGEAHRGGRFHGGITPADIGFDTAGELVLEGWGRDTTPDPLRASRYAPIECYAPVHPQGPWTDVYALGAIFWRAIAGGPPADVLHRKGDVTLVKLAPRGFDPHFLATVDAALEIAPQRRPQSIDAWITMFAPRSSTEHPGRSPTIVPATHPPATSSARRLIWPTLVVAALAVVPAVLWLERQPVDVAGPATVRPQRQAPILQPQDIAAPPAAAVVITTPTEPSAPAEPIVAALPASAAPKPQTPRVVADRPKAPVKVERRSDPPQASVPAEPAAAPPAVAAAPAPEPEIEGEAPRALLVRADKRLRRLFDDYARLRARVERSYNDPDIPYDVKRHAYREGLRLQEELVELRDARNRIARTGDFQKANRRYDDLEAAAAEVGARMETLRRSI